MEAEAAKTGKNTGHPVETDVYLQNRGQLNLAPSILGSRYHEKHLVVISYIPVEGHAHPASHGKHALSSIADVYGLYVPATHDVGAIDPSGQ